MATRIDAEASSPPLDSLPPDPDPFPSSSALPVRGRNVSRRHVDPRSINGLLRKHCRERLYVNPVRWTSRQMNLLDCHFVANQQIDPAIEESIQKSKAKTARDMREDKPSADKDASTTMVKDTLFILRHGSVAPTVELIVQDLLEHKGFSRLDSKLYFWFGRRKVTNLQPSAAVFTPPQSTAPPVAYIYLDSLHRYREKHIAYRASRGTRMNTPGVMIRHKEWRRTVPSNPTEDPYIAAILIALAQRQRHQTLMDIDGNHATSSTDERSFYKVHALVFPRSRFYLYTAMIPASFLDRLDNPSAYFPSQPFQISYFEIPLHGATRIRLMRHALAKMAK